VPQRAAHVPYLELLSDLLTLFQYRLYNAIGAIRYCCSQSAMARSFVASQNSRLALTVSQSWPGPHLFVADVRGGGLVAMNHSKVFPFLDRLQIPDQFIGGFRMSESKTGRRAFLRGVVLVQRQMEFLDWLKC
jgi:hypothetical protein